MPEQLAPVVHVEETGPGVPSITGVPTATTAFLGWTPTGPTDIAMPVHGAAEFEQLYGAAHPRSWLAHGVRHFFANGGRDALIVRIAGRRVPNGVVVALNYLAWVAVSAVAAWAMLRG